MCQNLHLLNSSRSYFLSVLIPVGYKLRKTKIIKKITQNKKNVWHRIKKLLGCGLKKSLLKCYGVLLKKIISETFLCNGLKKIQAKQNPQKPSVQFLNKQNKFLLELRSVYFPLILVDCPQELEFLACWREVNNIWLKKATFSLSCHIPLCQQIRGTNNLKSTYTHLKQKSKF